MFFFVTFPDLLNNLRTAATCFEFCFVFKVMGYAFATFITSWLEVKDNGVQTFAGPFLDYQLCVMAIIGVQCFILVFLSFIPAK